MDSKAFISLASIFFLQYQKLPHGYLLLLWRQCLEDGKYGTKASCPQVSQDGCEVENLLSKNTRISHFFSMNNGFLVERFVRPPVDINFSFPFPIYVYSIELGLCVGAQKTDGIEVLVTDDQNENGVFRVVFHQCPIRTSYLKIRNHCFKTRPPFVFSSEEYDNSNNGGNATFKSSHLLNCVRCVKIRLIKTQGSSVPGLGSAKIFGIPSRACSSEECKRVLNLHTADSCKTSEDDVQILPSENPKMEGESRLEMDIPEEFLDPITYEIMTLPVLLPSGHSVDQSTLEKSNTSQASWGRIPCDPFTGIPFGPGRQPITNTPLKCRIDAFLVKNARFDQGLARVPRTIGERPMEFSLPRPCSFNNSENTAGITEKVTKTVNLQVKQPGVTHRTEDNNESNHEKALQSSLDLALKSYYQKPPGSQPRANCLKGNDTCVGCRLPTCASRYKLPCGHSVCRKCLLSSQNLCLLCKKPFLREQVCRTYSIP